MEQNNFEKKIQQRLDELKLLPSEAVWENVEKNIRKRKDKKKALLFLLLLISLAIGGYYIFDSRVNNNNSQNHLAGSGVSNNSKQTINNDSSFDHPSAVIPTAPKGNIEPGEPGKNESLKAGGDGIHRPAPKNLSTTKNAKVSASSGTKNIKKNKSHVSNLREAGHIGQNGRDSKQTNIQENDLEMQHEDNEREKSSLAIIEDTGNNNERIPAQTKDTTIGNQNIPLVAATGNVDELKKSNAEPPGKKPKSKEENTWKFGVTFSGGTSMISGGSSTGATNFNSVARMDFVSLPYLANNYTFSTFSNNFKPSEIKNSLALIGGVFIERKISPKNKIDLGITYKYYSLTNTTGNKIDFNMNSSLPGNELYSSWSNTNTYRNNFHYIEIPVSFKFQLGRNASMPFYWSVGANVSQLLASNSLQFKSNPGLYYNDNSLFNKTQVGLQTGISTLLFSKGKVPLGIGPYVIYNTSKLANEGMYGGRHFIFIGLKTEIFLWKK